MDWSLAIYQQRLIICIGEGGLRAFRCSVGSGHPVRPVAMSAGPVDAAYKAIDALVRVPVTLEDYTMNSVTEGITALAVTRVTVRPAADMAESLVTTAQVCCAALALPWSVSTGSTLIV